MFSDNPKVRYKSRTMSGYYDENMKRNIFNLNGGELFDILTPYHNFSYQSPTINNVSNAEVKQSDK